MASPYMHHEDADRNGQQQIVLEIGSLRLPPVESGDRLVFSFRQFLSATAAAVFWNSLIAQLPCSVRLTTGEPMHNDQR